MYGTVRHCIERSRTDIATGHALGQASLVEISGMPTALTVRNQPAA